MNFKINKNIKVDNISDIKNLIKKLFKGNELLIDYVNIYGDEVIYFNVRGMNGKNITSIIYPFNIKHKSTLGFFDYVTGLTILPVNLKGIYKIKNSNCSNKPIRDLFSITR